jgi:hypothetical protein
MEVDALQKWHALPLLKDIWSLGNPTEKTVVKSKGSTKYRMCVVLPSNISFEHH